MISIGGVSAFWIIALLTLHGATPGETQIDFLNEPNVPFPPAAPTAENIGAICNHGQGRPRYRDSFFPPSGVSHFRNRGRAINRLESWYTTCCQEQETQILCCAQQAWKRALSQFCVEEYSIKARAYDCCRDKGDARWRCFNTDLPNPTYSGTPGYTAPSMPQEPGFTFISDTCETMG